MGRKNQQQALLAGPPAELTAAQAIGRVEVINGNNIYTVTMSQSHVDGVDSSDKTSQQLVELPPKFRNSMWIRRGGFVLVDCGAFEGRDNKLAGEIMTVIHDEKSWRKMNYWPEAFTKTVSESLPAQDREGPEDDDEDDLLGPGNLNRRRRQDSSDEEEE